MTGGPLGSSFVSTEFSYFGFEGIMGSGPVISRAHDNQNASGDAFVGDWISGGVGIVSAMVYHETPENLSFFLRVSTAFNFPGAVFQNTQTVEPLHVDLVFWILDPNSPNCIEETVTCAEALASVGNLPDRHRRAGGPGGDERAGGRRARCATSAFPRPRRAPCAGPTRSTRSRPAQYEYSLFSREPEDELRPLLCASWASAWSPTARWAAAC